MNLIPGIFQQAWRLSPLLLLFVSGYVVYRMLAFHKVTDQIAFFFVKQSRGKAPVLVLYILLGSAVLSFFISNTIAVLTIIPIVRALRDDFLLLGYDKKLTTTTLVLPLIFGANIGGMGSLIGGPAHLILLGSVEMMGVPGREQISFGSWFLWSLPMTALLILAAWLILMIFAMPRSLIKAKISLEKLEISTSNREGTKRIYPLFYLFIIFWVMHAVVFQSFFQAELIERLIVVIFFLIFLYLVLIKRDALNGNRPILPWKQLFCGLPPRLFFFIGLFMAIIFAVRVLSLDTYAIDFFTSLIGQKEGSFMLLFVLILTVTLLTEFFSNTVVATAFMTVAFTMSTQVVFSPLALMIAVSCAATCAFMTPIATPSNAIAFAEMKSISLRKMVLCGAIMNVTGAAIMAIYLPVGVKWVFGV